MPIGDEGDPVEFVCGGGSVDEDLRTPFGEDFGGGEFGVFVWKEGLIW